MKGKGSAFIMSILAVSVAMVAIAGTGSKIEKAPMVGKIPEVPSPVSETYIPDTNRRNLREIEDYQAKNAIQVYEPSPLPNHQEIEKMLK